MFREENLCVGCDVCYHCGKDKSLVLVCDECNEYAQYQTSEGALCEDCLEKMVDYIYKKSSLREKAEYFGIEIY